MSTSYENERVLSPDQLEAAMANGRQIRSRAFKSAIGEAVKGVALLLRAFGGRPSTGASPAH